MWPPIVHTSPKKRHASQNFGSKKIVLCAYGRCVLQVEGYIDTNEKPSGDKTLHAILASRGVVDVICNDPLKGDVVTCHSYLRTRHFGFSLMVHHHFVLHLYLPEDTACLLSLPKAQVV